MFNLVSLVVAAALVSLQCSREANALLERKLSQHSNIESNEIPMPRRKVVAKYVKINEAPPETIYNPEIPLVLQCEVWGKPAPFVTWLKNGHPINDFQEESNEILSTHPTSIGGMRSKLIVNSAINGDEYSCVATAGLKQKTATTTIYTDEDFVGLELPGPPVITAYYDSLLQVEGSSVVLPCRYYSQTNAQVFWLNKDGELVFNNSKMRVLPSGDLQIKDLLFSTDKGIYTCTVKNMYGSDTISTFLYTTRA